MPLLIIVSAHVQCLLLLWESSLLILQYYLFNFSNPASITLQGFPRWGKRQLSPLELGHVIGLPQSLADNATLSMFPSPRVQILESPLGSFLSSLPIPPFDMAASVLPCPQRSCPPPVPNDAPTYLPSLQKTLSTEWAHVTTVSQKATKADGAVVNLHLWDKRITSVLPRSAGLLMPLRGCLIRYQKRRIFQEFLTFLCHKHSLSHAQYRQKRDAVYQGLLQMRFPRLFRQTKVLKVKY